MIGHQLSAFSVILNTSNFALSPRSFGATEPVHHKNEAIFDCQSPPSTLNNAEVLNSVQVNSNSSPILIPNL